MQEMQEKIYAELPQSTGEHRYGGGTYTEAQLRLYADDTHALRTQALAAQVPQQEVQERIPDAWTNLLAYALQGDMNNRLTPRVVDIAYNAFMLAKQPNTENGGASDWFNDTKPAVTEMIEKLRKDLIEDFAAQSVPSGDAAKDALKALEDIFKEVK